MVSFLPFVAERFNLMAGIRISKPTKCILWQVETLSIERLRQSLRVVTTYIDDSHLMRTLLQCDECGQLYFHEFYEEIDWKEGKDAQYMTWIPIDDAESGDELNRMSPLALLVYPSIRYDYPMGADQPTGPNWSCPKDPSRAT
jgi:hypothetical protein